MLDNACRGVALKGAAEYLILTKNGYVIFDRPLSLVSSMFIIYMGWVQNHANFHSQLLPNWLTACISQHSQHVHVGMYGWVVRVAI